MTVDGPLLLAGGGHSHALVLKRWAMHPQHRPSGEVVLINRHGTAFYSGMVPGLIAGDYDRDDVSVDLRHLCDRAGVAFMAAEIEGIDPTKRLLNLEGRPPLRYGRLSLNVGAVSRPTALGQPIKPLERALDFLREQDQSDQPFRVIGAGAAGIEVVLALRCRWPKRPLLLQARPDQIEAHHQRALERADIVLLTAAGATDGPTLLCTGSQAPDWLKASGLPVDQDGRVQTDACLEVCGHPGLFASGDCAVIGNQPRPPSGVWAVRAAIPLARNLQASCLGKPLQAWRPQQQALQLLGNASLQPRQAWARRGPWTLGASPRLWQLKQAIDRRFMAGFKSTTPMAMATPMACRGCAAKLPAAPLQEALQQVGLGQLASNPEDASVLPGLPTQLQSVDGFPALISDAWLNGRLSALHACSDLWACGAHVASAMAVITLPAVDSAQQQNLLAQTLAGLHSALVPQGAQLLGGHTLEGRSEAPMPASLGIQVALSVHGGTADPGGRIWRKRGIRSGDALLLSRPLGTGVLFAGAMAGRVSPTDLDSVLATMSRSQHECLGPLLAMGEAIHACTDVTGFGLLGHLGEMLGDQPTVQIQLDGERIPAYAGSLNLLAQGLASTLAPANRLAWRWLDPTENSDEAIVTLEGAHDQALLELLVDPQTCGPLLVACDPKAATVLSRDEGWHWIGNAAPARG